ncbi:MAG: RidA family protein [Dehalococcoidia bacterium]|nr:RidA family protein [Dehalococcoidia bacterium]
MPREVIRPQQLFNSPAYSHAIKKTGTPLFISGQVSMDASGAPLNEGDAGAQARVALASLKAVVETAGGSMDDIVKITIFTTDLAHRAAISAARSEFFAAGEMPASTFLVVSSLADPRWLVEIEAVAMIG